MQACAPAVDLYVLLAQGAQAEPAGPVYPALHRQAFCEELPPGETALAGQGAHAEAPLAAWYDDAGHAWHTAEPTTLLYVPAAHDVQTPPSGPVKPVSQGHVVKALPPVPEFAGQLEHACGPLVLLYVAVRHGQHEPPFGPEYPALH